MKNANLSKKRYYKGTMAEKLTNFTQKSTSHLRHRVVEFLGCSTLKERLFEYTVHSKRHNGSKE